MSNEPKISHFLGVDFGKAHVGLAIAENEIKIATAYGTLDNNKDLFQKLASIIEKEGINKVIIGIPVYKIDEKATYPAEDFGLALSKVVPNIEIEFASEMFSTKIAQANLIAKGVKGIKKHDHEEAARIILQGWLDRIAHSA